MNGTGNDSPRRGQSRETGSGDSPTGHTGPNGVHVNGGESGKPSKPRYMNPQRTTMNDMKRRVAAILEFISKTQLEMAASGEHSTPPNGEKATATKSQTQPDGDDPSTISSKEGEAAKEDSGDNEQAKKRDFNDLSSVEMMDVLTRDLLKWQQEFGKYGEK